MKELQCFQKNVHNEENNPVVQVRGRNIPYANRGYVEREREEKEEGEDH